MMKAYIEQVDCHWNIQEPGYTWIEPVTGFACRGENPPDNAMHLQKCLGKASVSIEATFAISGNPTGKEGKFAKKLMELLKEFEV